MQKPLAKDELLQLIDEGGGTVTPNRVVEFATDPKTALHEQFEWDNGAAAERWRLHQARNLLRVFVEVPAQSKHAVRVFVSLPGDRHSSGGYRTFVSVMSDEERRGELLAMAMADMERFASKYHTLNELADVLASMRKARNRKQSRARKRRRAG